MTSEAKLIGPFTELGHFLAILRKLRGVHPKDPLLNTLIRQVLPKYKEYHKSKDSGTYLEFMKSAGFIDKKGLKISQPVEGTLAHRVKPLVDEYLRRKIVETPAKSQKMLLEFVVPVGAGAGNRIRVEAPDRRLVQVVLPEIAKPGQKLRVWIPLKEDRLAPTTTIPSTGSVNSGSRYTKTSTSASDPNAQRAAQTVAGPPELKTMQTVTDVPLYGSEDSPVHPDAEDEKTQTFRICWLLSRTHLAKTLHWTISSTARKRYMLTHPTENSPKKSL